MTHNNIYIKFMIEYDKANVTSSYPSLTEYEVATVLDKAYNALIAQKVTGNNFRRTAFEADLKSISDLYPLIKRDNNISLTKSSVAANVIQTTIPDDFLYYVGMNLFVNKILKKTEEDLEVITPTYVFNRLSGDVSSNITEKAQYAFFISATDSYQNAKFRYSGSDKTFKIGRALKSGDSYIVDSVTTSTVADLDSSALILKQTFHNANYSIIIFAEGDDLILASDALYVTQDTVRNSKIPYDTITTRALNVQIVSHQIAEKFFTTAYNMPWIKIPVCYIEDNDLYVVYDLLNDEIRDTAQLTYIKKPNTFVKDLSKYSDITVSYFSCPDDASDSVKKDYLFELNDTVAEELISLAVAFALENVESQRLNSKLNMRGLEA